MILALRRPNRGESKENLLGSSAGRPRDGGEEQGNQASMEPEKALGEILGDEHKWQSNVPECLQKSFRHMMKCLGLN